MQPIDPAARFLDLLGRHAAIIAPSHPGFGNSPRPADFDTVYDLMHLYLDLLESLPHEKVTLLGFSFGGWLAAEIAAACCHRIDRLILVDPFGIKISDRETPDIVDVFNTQPGCGPRPANGTIPTLFAPDFNAMDDAALVRYARSRDALCLYGFQPYMYNPQLKRWLARIAVPTMVVWGASDRIVTPELRPHLCRPDPGRPLHADRHRGPSSGDRATGSVCRPRVPLHRLREAGAIEIAGIHGKKSMDVWWQCEIPYPFVPKDVLDATDSVRATLPNQWCDPKIAADLYHEVLDEFLLCDDEGMNVLAIEHHAGINSLMAANPMFVGILARQTRKVRILSLGTLVSLRPRPRAHRRGIRHRRCDVARPAGDRVCEVGRHGDGVQPHQSGGQPGTLLGSNRPDPQGPQP